MLRRLFQTPETRWLRSGGLYLPETYLPTPGSRGLMLGNPCCCCGIFSDDFNRADSTNIGSDWTETTGDLSISSNTLTVATTGAICLCNTAASDAAMHVTVSVRGRSSNDIIRVLLVYLNTSNYHIAEFKVGASGYVKIIKRVAGTETTLITNSGNYITANTFTTVDVCTNATDNTMTASVSGSNASKTSWGGLTFAALGYSAAIGTGGTITTAADFDDFVLRKVSSACDTCLPGCSSCTSGDAPVEFQVVLAGLTDGACTCSTAVNGTYILKYVGQSAGLRTSNQVGCHWRYAWTSSACLSNFSLLDLYLYPLNSATPSMNVEISGGFLIDLTWKKAPVLTSCLSYSNVVLPFFANNGGICNNMAASTATVTTL